MKTLVIHPEDKTTTFLKEIYRNINYTLIDNPFTKTKDIIKAIKEHDRIIICGHGSPSGLFGGTGMLVNFEMVPYLREKEMIAIWCNADKFMEKHNLSGFYSGMFISEIGEAKIFGFDDIEEKKIVESNYKFSTLMGDVINKSLFEIFEYITKNYPSLDNPISIFNSNRLYFAKIENDFRVVYSKKIKEAASNNSYYEPYEEIMMMEEVLTREDDFFN